MFNLLTLTATFPPVRLPHLLRGATKVSGILKSVMEIDGAKTRFRAHNLTDSPIKNVQNRTFSYPPYQLNLHPLWR